MALASAHVLALEDPNRAETAAWGRFATARDDAEFHASWLAVLCSQIERVSAALLLLGPDQDGCYAPAAFWPDASRDLQYLGAAAQAALRDRRGVVVGPDGAAPPAREQAAHVAYPIEVSGVLHGAVVLDVAPGAEAGLQRTLRLVHWAIPWLADRFRHRALEEREGRLGRLGTAMDLVATAVQEHRSAGAALAIVNELATRLHCERVSLGFERRGSIRVAAISNTAVFDARMSIVRLIGNAMDEVLDQDQPLGYPGDLETGAAAHAELAREARDAAICSVPLLENGHATGVLTLERSEGAPFDHETIDLCRTIGGLVGPLLGLKRENERGVLRRCRDAAWDAVQALFGPRHPGVKLLAALAAAAVLFLSLANGPYRVTAKAMVEGAVQRAVVAPFDGHIAESRVRAGETVVKGQVLARLDDRDLRLERARLVSEREQAFRKQRQALASLDRSSLMVLAARAKQAEAGIALVDDRLARATLTAPFDGVVVSGDLSRLLGAPVERGKMLFQVAPLHAYRVILQVDERDIGVVALQQTGALILSGLPGQHIKFRVQQITPVSITQDGRNFFRVEAHVLTGPKRLRPGMEGVGKIYVEDRRLIWIWTHSLVDWLRTWIWTQMP